MKRCKKLFAAILSLCMIATMFVAVPVSAATENVIDINLALDDASELTWCQPNVTVSNADGIGGRDKVLKAEGLANSNNNTVGIKLPDGFAFEESDILTFSIDVYSDTVIHPDMWLRDHLDLAPFAQFGFPEMEVDAWTTITRSVKYEDMVTISTDAGSSGEFNTVGKYAFYLRPRETAGVVYLDNLSLTVEREVIERGNVIDMEINSASDVTWAQPGVTVSDANGIGGRDNVVKMAGLSNSNNNTAGVKLPDGFAFQEGDILSYSFDIYAETAGTYNPDMWMRNHDSTLNPFATFYEQPVAGNTWVTVTQRFTYEQMNEKIASTSTGTFDLAGNYAFYLRPRSNITAYIDNFKVTVARVGYEAPEEVVRKNVVDVDVESASDITWTGSEAVVVSDANGIGGRDNVVKAEGVADSNNNTVGIKLGDNFAFQADDILTFKVDVYSETAINPDMWLRNHTNLPTYTVFYHTPIATNTWTTITKTVTYAELVATGVAGWDEEGVYAFYLRPRGNATVYLDNFKVTVSRVDDGDDEPVLPPVDPDEPGDDPEIPEEPDVNRENVIDIDLALDAANELTWVASEAVTVTAVDGIGGRDKVLKAEGLANANGNSVGVKLPDGFAFCEGDVLTYSVDVYSETANNPDMWLRNHGASDLNPVATFYQQPLEVNTWTTITKTLTYEDMVVASVAMNSAGNFNISGKYAFYVRPRSAGTLYLDNFKLAVSREVIERGNVIDIEVNSAGYITWCQPNVTVTDANGIGGRDNVVKMEGLANSNDNTAGVVLANSFAFCEGDILTYSFDIYSEAAINPDIWVRNHGSGLTPFLTLYHEALAANTWTTIEREVTYADLMAAGAFDSADKYALYIRPRSNATVYIDNFKVTVARVDYVPVEKENVVDFDLALDAANELTWVASDAVVVTEADGIGGRDKVLKAEGLANSNNNTVGIKLPNGFAFDESDIITYSVDVYSETAITPDMWLRNHGTALTPFITFYHDPMAANTWTTLTKTVTYSDLLAGGDGWTNADEYAFYLRPRSDATVYLDNLKLTITREMPAEPDEPEEVYIPGDVDNDGEVVVRDVITLRRFIAGGYDITVNDAALDIDRDGEVMVRDVITLRRFIAGGYDVELQ